MHQATAYGLCLERKLDNLTKHACQTEWDAVSKCMKTAVRPASRSTMSAQLTHLCRS